MKINENTTVVIRGAGDLATGIAHRLYRCGFKIIMLEVRQPMAIRRRVALSEAVYDGTITVEGVTARFAQDVAQALKIISENSIAVLIDPEARLLDELKPLALVDAIMAKKNLGTSMDMAPIVIGVGPGFCAGLDCHAVVETQRGHNLGKVIFSGRARENTGIPGEILGFSKERVIYAPADGKIKVFHDIGSTVKAGCVVAEVSGTPVEASIDGVVRGMIRDGTEVFKGMKIGDVDPRQIVDYCYTISDKARAIGGGVLEAILYFMNIAPKRSDEYC